MLEVPLQADPETVAEGINLVWALVATFLVFFMHAGFGMLESGQGRSKNVANQLTKNLLIWGFGVIAYFVIGAGVSAAVAERAQLGGYLVFTVFVGALIYPVATGLTWGVFLEIAAALDEQFGFGQPDTEISPEREVSPDE